MYKNFTRNHGAYAIKFFVIMKLAIIFVCMTVLQVSAARSYGQMVTLNEKNQSIPNVLKKLRKQTGYDFVYKKGLFQISDRVTITVTNVPLVDALDQLLSDKGMNFSIDDHIVWIKQRASLIQNIKATQTLRQDTLIKGLVIAALTKKPMPGVTVLDSNKKNKVQTDEKGAFQLLADKASTLVFSYLGYKTKEIPVNTIRGELVVSLEETVSQLNQVEVNTGMFKRKEQSFTGAVATFSGAELKKMGNQNIIQSIRSLDPSFLQIENNNAGSNPNALPTLELRGQTSITTTALRDRFMADPNQPLYILDGFETTLRNIFDLDMNTVASVTILKDAASTALYGSRASNGVVVVETRKPLPGKLRFSYTSDLNLATPDLTSYNMMNAEEKLEFEKMARRYTTPYGIDAQLALDSLYNKRLREVRRGVNTYWLSQPLQTGFSQRHSINASGGDAAIRYDVGANLKQNNGTMIGSGRKDWGANIGLVYRTGILNIANRIYINGFDGTESPYGTYSQWVNTNPYYEKLRPTERYLEQTLVPTGFANTIGTEKVPNPFYNASLNSFNKNSGINIQNNFQLNADFNNAFRFSINAQVFKNNDERTLFVSPLHTTYLDLIDPNLKGSYTYNKLNSTGYTINANITFNKIFSEAHSLTSFLRAELSQTKNGINGYTAVGFPNNSNGNPAFSYGFEVGGIPVAASYTTRRNSIIASVNYSYRKRINLDLNLNIDGSTAFGSNNRYSPYYAAGLSWNLHNERFLENIKWIYHLRLRGNIGVTGNQNFGNVSQSVYSYNNVVNSFGQGVLLKNLGAPNLEWQKTMQTSLGVDVSLLENRINLTLNVYRKTTDPLVVAVTLPTSTGLDNYPLNTGVSNQNGIEVNTSFSPVYRVGKMIWTIGATATVMKQRYSKFNNQLNSLNTELAGNNSLTRFRDGYSAYDIWAVPSIGIDPATGNEVFLRKNGQRTFIYDPADQVVVGSSMPDMEGVLRTNLFYRGFTAGVYVRYILGRDLFNSALFNKVENISYGALAYNQDKRALYNRWKNPGDVTPFKNISVLERTPISSRFVQRENTFTSESVNIGYEFKDRQWLAQFYLSSLVLNAYSNDLFHISTIRRERGIDYPFARSLAFSVRATFK